MVITTQIISSYKNIIASVVIIIVFTMIINNMFSNYFLEEDGGAVKAQELEKGRLTIKRWKRLKQDEVKLNSVFLTKDTLLFKKFVEERANASKIDIIALKTSNEEKELYWEAKMDLSLTCNYSDFVAFIKAIEEKSVIIDRVRMLKGKKTGKTEINLTLKGFILKG